MKNCLFIISFFTLFCCSGFKTPINYSQTIIADKTDNADLKLSITDLKNYLEKITGKIFSVKEAEAVSSSAIYLKLITPGILSNSQYNQLLKGSIEDFVIKTADSKLFIVANNPVGLCHGIYTYLDILGVRWYFPGSLWEYIPKRTDISLSLNQYYSPSFHLRNFFGTGGIAPVPSVDPSSELVKLWTDWKRRNRMNGEVSPAGHYGETFNSKYKEVLQQHPEYLAMVNGKREPWSPSAKLCINNPAVQKLYIEDRIAEGKSALNNSKGSEKITISVEPSDGDGDCECGQCKKMGTVSDRDFFLANQVAKSFEKISPKLFANLYAYNSHAAPPSFSLSPQLIVQIIPYAYQLVSKPEEFIQQWKSKSKYLLLYDYYGLPDWHYNLPLSGGWSQEKLIEKIKYWYTQSIKGFTLESSYSLGSTGLGLYLAARTGWDVGTNIETEKNNFYKNLFNNSVSIKTFFQKLNSFDGSPDVPFLLKQLSLADEETKHQFSDRIDQWKAYLHYVLLYYSLQNANGKEKQTKWEQLMDYCWKIYPTALIHTTRLDELFCSRFGIPSTITSNWDVYIDRASKLQQVSFLSKEELQMLIKQDEKEYPVLKDFSYQSINKNYRLNIDKMNIQKEVPDDGIMLLEFPETYIQSNKEGVIQFWVKTNETSQNNDSQNVTIELTDTSGKTIQTKKLTITKQWSKIVFKADGLKLYKINVQNNNWIRFYSGSSQWLAFASIPVHAVMGKLYFQLPSNTSSFYYENASPDQPVFKTKDGKTLVVRKINDQNLYQVNVPASSSVQTLTMESSEYKYLNFYSIPGLFFLYPNYTLQ